MTLKVKMLPYIEWFESGESGIHTVVRNYFKYLPDYDIELVTPQAKQYDLLAVHAGSLEVAPPKDKPVVNHSHGLYFTADYDASKSEYEANRRIVNILHYAKEVTVPSAWVAEVFQRDLRFTPHIIGHGVDWQEWQHNLEPENYVIAYPKNRVSDACSNLFVTELAKQFPNIQFICTFAPKGAPSNVHGLGGTIPYDEMKKLVQGSKAVISPAKETYGLLTLEAMAAGKPILGINKGGNVDLIEHGQTGYLYEDDITEGLDYCLRYGKALGDNGREAARAYTWQAACEAIANVYRLAMIVEPPSVSVIIPVYNKPVEQVQRAVESCLSQSIKPEKIVIVDDGSKPGLSEQYDSLAGMGAQSYYPVEVIHQPNQTVAIARNNGIAHTTSKYVCCLDSDDWLDPTFLEICVKELEADNSLGLAYTGLTSHEPDGTVQLSPGNPEWDYDRMIDGVNTVWTCNVFRRIVWERLGGYRARYCPDGAGEEDGELWLRMGAYGWKARKVTDKGLFHYSWKSGLVTGNREHKMTDYRGWHSWVSDHHHPLASYATPINGISHPVRQYDEPIVSVIIPVGPSHEHTVIDALDSLESQRFRRWEAIVVDDTDTTGWYQDDYDILSAYPYVRYVPLTQYKTELKPLGAGYARNRGVEIARAPLILFLDADDTLRPIDALGQMVNYWNQYQAAIYTDYVGQAVINETSARKLQKENRLESYNPKTGEAIIAYERRPFDCQKALAEPTTLETAYNWNLVSTLLPRAWHNEIGGFDEAMDTLEDWDYWLRLAKAGHCFKHLPEKLVRYRLRAGERHIELDSKDGRQKAEDVLEYIRTKHKKLEIKDVGCGCRKQSQSGGSTVMEASSTMNDDDFVQATYIGSRGNHHIRGSYVWPRPPRELFGMPYLQHTKRGDGYVINYGYGDHGLETLVHKQDVALQPGKWQVKPEVVKPVEVRSATPPPDYVSPLERLEQAKAKARQQAAEALAVQNAPEFDLESLSAVTSAIAKRMRNAGLDTPAAIRQAGLEGLQKIKGIAEARATAILEEIR
jgi:glycosyltransferase involved in cell wall biosynthesis